MSSKTIATIENVNAMLEGTTIAPIVVPKPKAAKKAAKKADNSQPVNVPTKNGGMMDSRPGSITNGQYTKLVALCEKIGEPMTKEELAIVKTWSMAYTSDYRFEILNPEA